MELSRLHAWPICCAVGNTSRFAQYSWSQMKHDAIQKYTSHQMRLKWWRTYLPSILCNSALRSVVTSWANIDLDWLPVDHGINPVHRSNERVRAHVCVENSWRQQVCMCYTGGKNPSGSCRFASERFHRKEQKSSRDSSDLSPIQSK